MFFKSLVALTVLATVAHAQPGETPPQPPEAPPAAEMDLDTLFARIDAASPVLANVAKGTLRRARRSVAIGPTVGAWGGVMPSPSEIEGAITFGIGLEVFKIPVLPTMENLKALVTERAKAKLREQVVSRITGGREPDPLELEKMANEVWEEAIKEVLGMENIRPKTFERPKLSLGLEVNRTFDSAAWGPRARIGVGVWKFTVAGSVAALFAGPTGVYLGPEIVLHALTSKSPRSPVVDVFLRFDFEVRHRENNTDQVVLGARFLLDLI